MEIIHDNIGIIALVLGIPLFIVGQVFFLVRKMSEPEQMYQSLSGLDPSQEAMLAQYQPWLASMGLYPIGYHQFGAIRTATFQQTDTQRFFSFYFHQRLTYSIETYFDDTNCSCIDTSNSGSIGMFPQRPGQYQQSFPGVAADVLWQRHLEGEQYVQQRMGVQYANLSLPYDQILMKAMRLRMAYVRSIPLYPFRALYWYFVVRKQMANRSVQQQFP
jgi:hypothetical protein